MVIEEIIVLSLLTHTKCFVGKSHSCQQVHIIERDTADSQKYSSHYFQRTKSNTEVLQPTLRNFHY